MNNPQNDPEKNLNRDPITGEPGCHAVGTGVGTAGGALAGAAVGAVGGPVGSLVGAVVGGIAGAATGHAVAEGIDPTAEDAYWKENAHLQPYYIGDYNYNDYRPAYRMGYEGYGKRGGRSFNEVEPELSRDWDKSRGESRLKWEHARDAVRDGWHRVERVLPGDADGDGR